MESYYTNTEMCIDVFIEAISKAQQHMGQGQRLNAVIDDIYTVFCMINPKTTCSAVVFWHCLFDPIVSKDDHKHRFQELYTELEDPSMNKFLQWAQIAITDPPATWWKDSTNELLRLKNKANQ